MKSRIKELDYLKCVFILLMVAFHLVYIGDTYPYLKKVVYTFHMSGFLIISGYLTNVQKDTRSFLLSILWIFIPYAFMEAGYVVMSAILPVREKVAELSVSVMLHKVFVAPLGTYWYLHTLMICSVAYYFVYKLCAGLAAVSRFIILGVCLFLLTYTLKVALFSNVIYYLIGVAVYQSGLRFTDLFRPSLWALVPLLILCLFPENLERGTLAGVAITYLAISSTLFLHGKTPGKLRRLSYFIGQNTLVILLFSPVFTILSRLFLPIFSFDPSGLLFMCVAVAFTVSGCIALAYASDKLNLSRIFFGKKRVVSRAEYE